MCCDNNEDNFVLTIMFALGVCLCVIAFFCGGEMMMKADLIKCVKWWVGVIVGILLLAGSMVLFCLGVSFLCHSVNCCKAIKISEKEYFVLTKENINNRCTLENQRNILVYNDLTCIPKRYFRGFNNLEKIEFYGETQIEKAAFFGCTNLNEVVFHDDIRSIGKNAFAGCKKLEEIILASGVTEISDGTFNNCKTLEKIDLPDTVQSIGKNAFKGCKSLATITIPKSVTSIGNNAFARCTKLLTINYAGTKNDWNTTITDFGSNWKQSVPATGVTCNDGKKYKLENDGKLSEVIAESCN